MSPEATSSVSDSATSATTSALRARCRARPCPACALPSRIASASRVSDDWNAGSSPNATADIDATSTVNTSTGMSITNFMKNGSSMGIMPSQSRLPRMASATPIAAPASARIRLSVRSWRTRRPREAPSAMRTLISRRRIVARASIRLATLAQAISSTNATANDMIHIMVAMPLRQLSAKPTTPAVQSLSWAGLSRRSRA